MNKLISRFLTFLFKDEPRRQVVHPLSVGLLALAVLMPSIFVTIDAFFFYTDFVVSALSWAKGVAPTLFCVFYLLMTIVAGTLSVAGSCLLVLVCYLRLTTPKQDK